MKCNVDEIALLVKKIEEEAGIRLSYSNPAEFYRKMENVMESRPPFGEDYLYKQVQHKLKQAEKNEETELSFNQEALDYLSRYIHFSDYKDFIKKSGKASVKVLEKYFGSWYSYVRCNSGQPCVLRSPVRIYQERNVVYMEMKGRDRLFAGELEIVGERLICLLKSGKEKSVYLLLNAGVALKPMVLQGVFSGLSSGGDPIAGREILVRQLEPYPDLETRKLSIRDLLDSEADDEGQVIGNYFSKREINILKAGRSSSFDLGDLKMY